MSVKLKPVTVGPLKSGDTIEHRIPVLDDSDIPVSLVAATVEYQIARRKGDSAALISLSTTDSPVTVTIVDNADSPPVLNTVVATIDKSLTETLRGTYYWEAQATDTLGKRATIAYGQMVFDEDLIP